MPFAFNTLLGRLISLQIFQGATLTIVPGHVAKSAHSSRRLIEDSIVRAASVQDIRNLSHLPFTTRSAWYEVQAECSDLRRTHANLKQGTRPSRKATNINDVKRYADILTSHPLLKMAYWSFHVQTLFPPLRN